MAGWIAAAEKPLIITTASGTDAMASLGRIAERYAIPVVAQRQRIVCLPTSHPMHIGVFSFGKASFKRPTWSWSFKSDVPYIPNEQNPRADCRFATIGEDPAFNRYPMRSFPSDLAVTATAASALEALEAALAKLSIPKSGIAARRLQTAEYKRKRKEQLAAVSSPRGETISLAYLSRAITEAVGDDAVIFNEYSLMQDHCPREKPDTYFGLSSAGGLGGDSARRSALSLRLRRTRRRDTWRRRLYVLQSDGRPLGLRRSQTSGTDGHLQ